MRNFFSPPPFFVTLKISKINIYSPWVKMGLKTGQNINFRAFLVFQHFSCDIRIFESQHQHFGVATLAFLSRNISILAFLLAML